VLMHRVSSIESNTLVSNLSYRTSSLKSKIARWCYISPSCTAAIYQLGETKVGAIGVPFNQQLNPPSLALDRTQALCTANSDISRFFSLEN